MPRSFIRDLILASTMSRSKIGWINCQNPLFLFSICFSLQTSLRPLRSLLHFSHYVSSLLSFSLLYVFSLLLYCSSHDNIKCTFSNHFLHCYVLVTAGWQHAWRASCRCHIGCCKCQADVYLTGSLLSCVSYSVTWLAGTPAPHCCTVRRINGSGGCRETHR